MTPPAPLLRVEIGRAALVHNVGIFRRLAGPKRRLLAVVKANAYGHGMLEVSRIVLGAGADWLGVHSLEEGLGLRAAGFEAPVLVLGYIPLDGLETAVAGDLRFVVYNDETLARLGAAAAAARRTARVHVKVETGTHRQGVRREDVVRFALRASNVPGVVVEGLTSHFANIEDTTVHDYPRLQLRIFREASDRLRAAGIRIPIRHMASTAAALLFPETRFDLVRAGIGLYGLWPSKETLLSCQLRKGEPPRLRPVLAWKARVAQVKDVPSGAFVGYGCSYRTTRRSRLAVVPAGYAEGYDRRLSNAGHVLIRGRRAPVRGRVAMDFFTADVTDIPGVRVEDEVTLIGRDGRERITADQVAGLAGTIAYEVVSRINPLVPRIVVR
jgi:alanine racemase